MREDYTAALNERRLVQGWLMRVTLHSATAADYRLRPEERRELEEEAHRLEGFIAGRAG